MAVNMGKMRDLKEEKDSGSWAGKSTNIFTINPNSYSWMLMCKQHENMGDMPWTERMYHWREVPDDARDASRNIVCQRSNMKDDAKCPGCKAWFKLLRKAKEEWERQGKPKDEKNFRVRNIWNEKADKYRPSPRRIAQVLDVTCLFMDSEGKQLKEPRPMKKCFLRFGKVEGCDECYMKATCEIGIKQYPMPPTVYDPMVDHFCDFGDLTDFSKMIPVRIHRTGKGMSSKYKTQVFTDYAFAMPEKMTKRILSGIEDLTQIDTPPTGTTEELKNMYKTFFELEDVETDDDDIIPDGTMLDDDDDSDKSSSKASETKTLAPEDDDDDDDNEGVEEVRKQLAADASQGQMNKDDDDDDDDDE